MDAVTSAVTSAAPPVRFDDPPTPRTGRRWHTRPALLSLAAVSTLLLLWQAVASAGWVPALFLPPPSAVLAKLVLVSGDGFMDATLWQHTAASLQRVGLALLLAVAITSGAKIARAISSTFDSSPMPNQMTISGR